jgi:16S rRNA (guanine527-N7)-methyltransferase
MEVREQLRRFQTTLETKADSFSVALAPATVNLLVEYYKMLLRWNERLHLVAPCAPELFATRHVLESLILLSYLPQRAAIADVGSGAGLPIIPCLIVRDDLRATLIESSPKKTVFLREVLKQVDRENAATIIVQPFEQIKAPAASFVTCRALDQFIDKLKALYDWSPAHCTLLLFGGKSLGNYLSKMQVPIREQLIPNSDQRFLYIVSKSQHTVSKP